MARLGEALGPEHLPRTVPPDAHPVVRHMLERQQNGSARGEREDDRVVALAIEGGGMRGTVSAGMCIALEATGLVDSVDVIYGISSGALNGSYAAAGQAARGASNYERSANRRFSSGLRFLRGRPPVDFDYLFEELIRRRNPHSQEGLARGPEFRTLAVDLGKKSLELLQDFEDIDDMMQAVRASCSIPVLSAPTVYHGRTMADGGLLEPVPYKTALRNGATDVLVLRTRPAGIRKEQEKIGHMISDLTLSSLVLNQHNIYNRQADELERLSAEESSVFQIAPPLGAPIIPRTEKSIAKVRRSLAVGTAACAAALGLEPTDILWQPTPYLAKQPDQASE